MQPAGASTACAVRMDYPTEIEMDNEPSLKVTMEGIGIVTNPDGTTKEIILRAERPLTEEELKDGDYTSISGEHRRD